jgi:DNA-binding protein HU-beta/DNA-binding protein HU-alpha
MATRDDIIANMQAAYTELGLTLSKKDCDLQLNVALEAVAKTVTEDGGSVRTCIGTFKLSHRDARDGRNPKTGETVAVPARNTLTFKAAPAYNVAEGATKASKAAAKTAPKGKVATPTAKAKTAPVAAKKVINKKK